MKKILATAALFTTLTSNAFAEENIFYVRLDGGAAFLPKIEVEDEGGEHSSKTSMKKITRFVGDIGVGTYIMDNLRSELTLGHYFGVTYKGSESDGAGKILNYQSKLKVTNLMLKGLVDVGDFEIAKLFVGGGVGAARVGATFSLQYLNEAKPHKNLSKSFKMKDTTNFAYTLTAGASFELAEGVKADLAYAWFDAGKTGSKTKDGEKVAAIRARAHNVTLGIRFEL